MRLYYKELKCIFAEADKGTGRKRTPGRHEPPPFRHEPPRFARQTKPPLCSKRASAIQHSFLITLGVFQHSATRILLKINVVF